MTTHITEEPETDADDDQAIATDLASRLPAMLGRALDNYALVALAEVPHDATDFRQHQAACKAALGHLEHLLRLVRDMNMGVEVSKAIHVNHEEDDLITRAEEAFEVYRGRRP